MLPERGRQSARPTQTAWTLDAMASKLNSEDKLVNSNLEARRFQETTLASGCWTGSTVGPRPRGLQVLELAVLADVAIAMNLSERNWLEKVNLVRYIILYSD